DHLALLPVAELEERKAALTAETDGLQATLDRERAEAAAQVAAESSAARGQAESDLEALRVEREQLVAHVAALKREVVVTEETAILQEIGLYEYRHPLSDAVAYQAELKRLQDQIKVTARKDGGAVLASTNWTVNNSVTKGRAMVREYSKLVLRAYDAEADNLVRGLKPYKLGSALERLW